MGFKFTPNRLINAKNEIVKLHSYEYNDRFMYTDKERKIIRMVVGWRDEQISVKYLTLSRDELITVVSYLPYNFDHLNMKNLFKVTCLALDDILSRTLLLQWNYSYKNKECNQFMSKLIDERKEFRKELERCHYNTSEMRLALRSENILQDYGKQMIYYVSNSESIQNVLDLHYVGANTMLYVDCLKYYFIYCRGMDYIREKNKILNIISAYDDANRRLFLINYLKELDLKDLFLFDHLTDICTSAITGNIDTSKYRNFFEKLPSEIEYKYRNWINGCKIGQFFGFDERSDFWKRYRFVSVQKNSKHGMVALECDDYYITEFLGKAMGAMYVYDKKTYKEKVVYWQSIYNKQELKSHMNHNERMAQIRMIHLPQPGWQRKFKDYILSNKITDTLY